MYGAYLENLNYYRDPRVVDRLTLKVTKVEIPGREEIAIRLPGEWYFEDEDGNPTPEGLRVPYDYPDLSDFLLEEYQRDREGLLRLLRFDDEALERLLGKNSTAAPAIVLAARYEVCDLCRGRGRVVNPSIDAGGITSSEWEEWEPEERSRYLSGAYDVPCPSCGGNRVALKVSKDHGDEVVSRLVAFVEEWEEDARREGAEYARALAYGY